MFKAIVLILLIPLVAGLGLGPVETYKQFTPNGTDTIKLVIFNNEDKEVLVNVYARGELKEYISYKKSYLLTTGQKQLEIQYTINYPEELSPGPHYAEIVVQETEGSSGQISALQSQVSRLQVQVPYTKPYAEAKLLIEPDDDSALFKLYVHSFSSEEFSAYASVDVFEGERKVTNYLADRLLIPPMQEKMASKKLSLAPGAYTAVADVFYSDQAIRITENFIVGRKNIIITDVKVGEFEAGKIVPITIYLQNEWPVELRGEAELEVEGEIIPSYTFLIDRNRTVTAYWDSKLKLAGNYSGIARVRYNGRATEKEFIIVVPERTGSARLPWMLPIVLVILVGYLVYRKYYLNKT